MADLTVKIGGAAVAVNINRVTPGPRGQMGGNVMAAGLADEIPELDMPSGTDLLATTGSAVVGRGRGSYVEDDLCDAGFMADHPMAVKESDNGRFARLDPGATVVVTPEQLGCPVYAAGVNAQPYIDAAIRYVEAMTAAGFKTAVQFTQETYESHTPLRVPDPAGSTSQPVPRGEIDNLTGLHFVVRRKVELRSAPGGTTIVRRCNDGSDPAVFANTQVTSDAYGYGYWRGGLFALIPQAAIPANLDELASIKFVGDWTLYGGLSLTNDPGLHTSGGKYVLGSGGKGWDIYDKALWNWSAWGDDYVGYLVEVYGTLKVDGFAGETFFGGVRHRGLLCRGTIEVCNSDAGHFDFGGYNMFDVPNTRFDADFLWAHDVYLGMERFGGWNVTIGHLRLERCSTAGSVLGGNYTEDDDGIPVSFNIGKMEVLSCGVLANGTHLFTFFKNINVGEIFLRDTAISIGRSDQAQVCANVTIGKVTHLTDMVTNIDAVVFTAAASVSTHSCSVGEINCLKTKRAITASRQAFRPFAVGTNAMGANLFVGRVTGDTGLVPGGTGAMAGQAVGCGAYLARAASPTVWNVETTPQLANGASMYLLQTTSGAGSNIAFTLPVASGYPQGSRIKLASGSAAVLSLNTANTRLKKRLMLINSDSVEFENIRNWWVQVGGTSNPLAGATTAALQKSGGAIPAGDVSDETTFTLNGAKAGMNVRVTPTSVISGDAQLIGRVTADNTVGIRARNLNLGGTLTLASATYRVELEWAS